jgi:hypothetical protein
MTEILGATAIVGSLVFVGMQLQQAQQIAMADAASVRGMMAIEFAALISDHSDVWARGVAQEELNDADKVVFENLVIAKNDAAYSNFDNTREIDGIDNAISELHIFAYFLHRHPGARQFWVEREADLKKYRAVFDPTSIEFVSPYVDTILGDLEELDRKQP